MEDILISIKPQYVNKILSGCKLIELRTRKVNVPEGTKVWIYSTLPEGEIVASGLIEKIELTSPENAWEKYSGVLCINSDDFNEYVGENNEVCLLHLNQIKELSKRLSLNHLRSETNFHPPQFFMKVSQSHRIAKILSMASAC